MSGVAHPLASTDVLARVLTYLSSDAAVERALGGTTADRIGARNTAPYPRLRLIDPPGGTLNSIGWIVAVPVQIEVWGAPDGLPGKAALATIMRTVQGALVSLPQAEAGPEDPVITAVRFDGAGGYSPASDGQPRYVMTVTVTAHPAIPAV
jgi:hypothetical protein